MSVNEVLFSDELRARIMQLEYSSLTEEEIRRIYMEETGQELTTNITIYHSSDYMDELGIGKNGFDGTIIHFYDEKEETNQVYSISRGSESSEQENWRPEDWMYNLFGIFVGKNTNQYIDAKRDLMKL